MTHATRIKEDLQLPAADRAALDQVDEVTGGSVNVALTLLHHPELAHRYMQFGLSFIVDGVLPARDRELIILRTAQACRSPYEWAQHVRMGLAAGLTEEEIRRITSDDLGGWERQDAELLAGVDTLLATSRLTEQQWAGLSSRYGTKGAVEAVMLAGHYFMLAGLLNSADTQIETGLEAPIPLG